jgi:MoxR-like ATPase
MAAVIADIAAEIVTFLQQNETEWFTEEQVYQQLRHLVGDRKGDYHVTYPLRALVGAGVLKGTVRNGKVVKCSFKSATDSSGVETVPKADMMKLVSTVRSQFEKQVTDLTEKVGTLTAEVAKRQSATRVARIDVYRGKTLERKIEGIFHATFEEILDLGNAREPIFAYGPGGSGKSTIGEQLAEALGLSFHMISCSSGMTEGQVLGRLLPVGTNGKFEFVGTEFLNAFENGGVFLADEIDAADPNTLLIWNSALANGRISLPNRPKKPMAVMHEDFVFIAAANTLGGGADRMYSGRNKLDGAFMDRFCCSKVMIGYDPNLEEQVCPDVELRTRLLAYRANLEANRLERIISTRFMAKAYKAKQRGWSDEKIDETLFRGWRENEINLVKQGVRKSF